MFSCCSGSGRRKLQIHKRVTGKNLDALVHGCKEPTFRAVWEKIGSGENNNGCDRTGVEEHPKGASAVLTRWPLRLWLDNRPDQREWGGTLAYFLRVSWVSNQSPAGQSLSVSQIGFFGSDQGRGPVVANRRRELDRYTCVKRIHRDRQVGVTCRADYQRATRQQNRNDG